MVNRSKQCQTVSNSGQTVPTASQEYRVTPKRPKNNDLIPADLRVQELGHSQGGHILGLKSNRRVFVVPRVILPPTCRHSSHTAVSTFSLFSVSQN